VPVHPVSGAFVRVGRRECPKICKFPPPRGDTARQRPFPEKSGRSRWWTCSAAVSEVEQYERVTLNVQPGISVRGPAVNDVVHLTAELAENATSFSSAETPVNVSGHLLSSGGVLLDITDQGVGMGADELAHANKQLPDPSLAEVMISWRLGLFVVTRLAARHGIEVRLRPAASGGLTALMWLPEELITYNDRTAPPWPPAHTGVRSATSGVARL
jgi:anti-sigma regulatory factor (Ser/Thr protein kinase)